MKYKATPLPEEERDDRDNVHRIVERQRRKRHLRKRIFQSVRFLILIAIVYAVCNLYQTKIDSLIEKMELMLDTNQTYSTVVTGIGELNTDIDLLILQRSEIDKLSMMKNVYLGRLNEYVVDVVNVQEDEALSQVYHDRVENYYNIGNYGDMIQSIEVMMENYPDLDWEETNSCKDEVDKIIARIQSSRQYYNQLVNNYHEITATYQEAFDKIGYKPIAFEKY